MENDNDRSTVITIGGEEHTLVLNTRATKLIGQRYGGLEKLSDKLLKPENFELAIEEIVWLITLLANQGILLHNLHHKDSLKELLSEEYVELITSPYEMSAFNDAILAAMLKGTKRNVLSEEPKTKNPKAV